MIDLVEISEHETGLEMKEGLFSRVLQPGKVGYWRTPARYKVQKVDLDQLEVAASIPRYILHKTDVLAHLRIFPDEAHEAGLLFIDGDYIRELGPGEND